MVSQVPDARGPQIDSSGAIERPDDVSTEWLGAALGAPVADFAMQQIGTGQLSESHRITLRYLRPAPGMPRSVVLKLAAADQRSRQTAVALGLYGREVRFYAELAPLLGGPVPACYHASFDRTSGTFRLLLGDAGPARQGDEIAGCSVPEAYAAVRALGTIHAAALAGERLAGARWLDASSAITAGAVASLLPQFFERYEPRIASEHRIVCERLAAAFDQYLAASRELPRGLVHGDYRLDNLLFDGGDPEAVTVVDWQTVTVGPALRDLAYFLGCALRTEDRRRHGEQLIREYHRLVGGALEYRQCLEGVRHQSFFGVMMAIVSPMLVERTERGDDMFMTVLARQAQQVLDLGALGLLPSGSRRLTQA